MFNYFIFYFHRIYYLEVFIPTGYLLLTKIINLKLNKHVICLIHYMHRKIYSMFWMHIINVPTNSCKCIVRKRALKKEKKLYRKRLRAGDEENFNGVHPFSAASSCYSMMMKSSTFFFLSRLDPFYPSPLGMHIIPVSV